MAVYYGDFDVSRLEGVSDGLEVRGAAFEVSVEGVHGLASGGYDYGVDAGDVAGGPGDGVVDVEGVFEDFEDSGEWSHLDALAEQAFRRGAARRGGVISRPTYWRPVTTSTDFPPETRKVGDGGGLGAALGVDDDDPVTQLSRSFKDIPAVDDVPALGARDFGGVGGGPRWR